MTRYLSLLQQICRDIVAIEGRNAADRVVLS